MVDITTTMADERPTAEIENFYLRHVESPDEQLLSIRHTLYHDNTQPMIERWQEMSKNPKLEKSVIDDTLNRLEHILKAERELQSKNWELDGVPITNLHQLMVRYKKRRKHITRYITTVPDNGTHNPTNGS